MLALGLVLNTVGIAFTCWLSFALAVYAAPFFVGLGVGLATLHSGAGVMGALLVGVCCSALTLVIGQIGFAMIQSRTLSAVVAAAFVVPAGIAGYHLVLGMSQIGVPSLVWREPFAWLGAILVGTTAWARISAFTEPRPARAG